MVRSRAISTAASGSLRLGQRPAPTESSPAWMAAMPRATSGSAYRSSIMAATRARRAHGSRASRPTRPRAMRYAADADRAGRPARVGGRYRIGRCRASPVKRRRAVLDGPGTDRARRSPRERRIGRTVAVLGKQGCGYMSTNRHVAKACAYGTAPVRVNAIQRGADRTRMVRTPRPSPVPCRHGAR